MIKLYFRGGAGGHMLCALLDHCTDEGNLDGYPAFDQGNNLHVHVPNHKLIKNQFYEPNGLYSLGAAEYYRNHIINNGTKIPKDAELVISPIATDTLGRILILTMGFGKTLPKQFPPYDSYIDYHGLTTVGEQIEKVALFIRDQITSDFEWFHSHAYPTYPIDVMWFYNNEYKKIIDVISACGWSPKHEKIKEFCEQVLVFNKPYYSILKNVSDVFNSVIKNIDTPCSLTFYETALVHGLLLDHYKIYTPEQIKLITKLPSSTKDFFNLYELTYV